MVARHVLRVGRGERGVRVGARGAQYPGGRGGVGAAERDARAASERRRDRFGPRQWTLGGERGCRCAAQPHDEGGDAQKSCRERHVILWRNVSGEPVSKLTRPLPPSAGFLLQGAQLALGGLRSAKPRLGEPTGNGSFADRRPESPAASL